MIEAVKDSLVTLIGSVSELEAKTEWIEAKMIGAKDKRIPEFATRLAQAKQLLFATSAQVTSDIYDASRIIVQRPVVKIGATDEGQDENLFLLEVITDLSEDAKTVLNELADLTHWDGLAKPLSPEMFLSACGKLRAAYHEIEGTKTALLITVAGYDISKFEDDGDIRFDKNTNDYSGGYV